MSEQPLDTQPLYTMDPIGRFADRATDYVAYRPTYPAAAIDGILAGLAARTAADIGAGTGISARLLADRGLQVWAIEPNAAMLQAATAEPRVGLTWQAGQAEATGLPAGAVDLVTCFQAFHWFAPVLALPELRRILRPMGRLALVWNDRNEADPLTRTYGEILKAAGSKPGAMERLSDPTPLLRASPEFTNVRTLAIPQKQRLDHVGLLGLAMSRSYTPKQGAAAEQLTQDLQVLHRQYADAQGQVEICYVTNVFLADRALD
jgi:SAM-dependent methyltransferase